MDKPEDGVTLDPVLVAAVSLAAGIASNHPAMGQCQLGRLRSQNMDEASLAAIVEIARHIRDEAAEKLDFTFDEKAHGGADGPLAPSAGDGAQNAQEETCGCSPTPGGLKCC